MMDQTGPWEDLLMDRTGPWKDLGDQEQEEGRSGERPCPLEEETDSSLGIMGLGSSNHTSMMRYMREYSNTAMLMMSLTCREMDHTMRVDDNMWRRAAETDYGTLEHPGGFTAYRCYQFLHRLKEFEGKYVLNPHGRKTIEGHHPNIPLDLVEVEVLGPAEAQVCLWDARANNQEAPTRRPPVFKIAPSREQREGRFLKFHSMGVEYWMKFSEIPRLFFVYYILALIPKLCLVALIFKDFWLKNPPIVLEPAVPNCSTPLSFNTPQTQWIGACKYTPELPNCLKLPMVGHDLEDVVVASSEIYARSWNFSQLGCLDMASEETADHQSQLGCLDMTSEETADHQSQLGSLDMTSEETAADHQTFFSIFDSFKQFILLHKLNIVCYYVATVGTLSFLIFMDWNYAFQRLDYYKNERWTLNDWFKGHCTFANILLRRDAFFSTMTQTISDGYLIPLKTVCQNSLDRKYLMEDKLWPESLPSPGVYLCGDDQVTVGYSAHAVHIASLLCHRTSFLKAGISVQVRSAMVMTVQDQLGLGHDEYMAFEKGLEGNPNQMTLLSPVYLPTPYGHFTCMCRAWYTPSPAMPFSVDQRRWKLLVRDAQNFVLVVGPSHRLFRQCPLVL